jgi:DNA-binding MarR family transcriptional regulator
LNGDTGKEDELGGISAIEGQFEHALVVDHLTDTRASCFDQGGIRLNFHLLGKLRSYGSPYQRSPGQLAADMHLSSGAMTNRLDRMEEAGLIRRLPDPSDRRGTLIEPTDAGHAAWDKTTGTQAVTEALIAGTLSKAEREELHRLLRRLMRAFPAKDHWAEAPTGEKTDAGKAEAIAVS